MKTEWKKGKGESAKSLAKHFDHHATSEARTLRVPLKVRRPCMATKLSTSAMSPGCHGMSMSLVGDGTGCGDVYRSQRAAIAKTDRSRRVVARVLPTFDAAMSW